MAKIGIIISSLYACGGEERVVSLMANEWVKQYEVTIFTFENREYEGNKNDYYISERIKVERVVNPQISIPGKIIRLLYHYIGIPSDKLFPKLLKKILYPDSLLKEWEDRINEEGFDVVIGISGTYTVLLGLIRSKISAKVIGWQHSSYEGYFDSRKGYYRNQEKLFMESFSRLDACVVLNEDIQKKYQKYLGIKTMVIHNPKSFVSEKKADVNQHCFITCGRVEAEKGYDDLIEAFYKFNKEDKGWKLLIVGGGSLKKQLEQRIMERNISDKAVITGYVHNVSELLGQGSIFMMTSRWEGFPMSITEALEMGLPVIAYDIPAMKPLVTDGVEGRIVPAFENDALVNAMKELASDEEKRQQMSDAALRKAATLTPESISLNWFKLFDELI